MLREKYLILIMALATFMCVLGCGDDDAEPVVEEADVIANYVAAYGECQSKAKTGRIRISSSFSQLPRSSKIRLIYGQILATQNPRGLSGLKSGATCFEGKGEIGNSGATYSGCDLL